MSHHNKSNDNNSNNGNIININIIDNNNNAINKNNDDNNNKNHTNNVYLQFHPFIALFVRLCHSHAKSCLAAFQCVFCTISGYQFDAQCTQWWRQKNWFPARFETASRSLHPVTQWLHPSKGAWAA